MLSKARWGERFREFWTGFEIPSATDTDDSVYVECMSKIDEMIAARNSEAASFYSRRVEIAAALRSEGRLDWTGRLK